MSVLKMTNIQKSFGDNHVLKDISFQVDKGEVVSIIGPSGSGKSTLLRCSTFLETIDSGTITYDDKNAAEMKNGKCVYAKKLNDFRHIFGLVFQNFNLFPHYTVLKNMMDAPVSVMKRDKNEVREECLALLRKMGLEDKADSYPGLLSGGQQQRVSIGRALMNAPSVVLADEPTGNLDSKNSQEIVELLKLSNRKYNQTLIVITHDESIALQADRIIAIEDGRITRDERIREAGK
jgi:polar amino acid transport system ATP-binding protein